MWGDFLKVLKALLLLEVLATQLLAKRFFVTSDFLFSFLRHSYTIHLSFTRCTTIWRSKQPLILWFGCRPYNHIYSVTTVDDERYSVSTFNFKWASPRVVWLLRVH